jgi:hypothetical protein
MTGGGTVMAILSNPVIGGLPAESDPSKVVVTQLRFDFAPVPEPGTLLLVGTGAVAMGGAWLRRRRRARW